MSDEREIRKETGIFGGEKEVIYVNGQKVGEIKSEERGGFCGIGSDTVKVEYGLDGKEVGYTKQEERGGICGFGTEEFQVRYDTHGVEVGQSHIEEKGGFLGFGTHHVRVECDINGNEISQSNWEKRGGLFGIGEKRVMVTRYKDGKPPTVVIDTGGGGSSTESNDSGAVVVIVLIIIGALWWFESNTKTNKSDTKSNIVSTSSQTETLYVNALQLNLRAGPGTSYEQIAKLNANDTVTILEANGSGDRGNWIKIRTGIYEGWVNRKFLSDGKINNTPLLNYIGVGCSCSFHKTNEKENILVSDFGDNAWLRLNGQDIHLKSNNYEEESKKDSYYYFANGMSINVKYQPAKDQSCAGHTGGDCEVFEYDATITVTGENQQTIRATGDCGC